MYSRICFAFTLTLCCLTALQVFAFVDGDECQGQMEDIFATEVNCTLVLGLDSTDKQRLSRMTQGIISDVLCVLPLNFPKSRIYDEFITKDLITLPRLQVTCTVFAGSNEPLEVTSAFSPNCRRDDKAWACEPNMANTAGLGVLGRLLENYVNNDRKLKGEMGRAIERLGRSQ